MSTLEALGSRFVQAVNAKASDFTLAHAVVHEMEAIGANDALVAFHEAHLLDLERVNGKSDALVMLLERCVRADDVPPAIQARCIVKATQLAMHLNDRAVMRELRAVAGTLFDRHRDDHDVVRWQAGIDLNVGMHLFFNDEHDEALRTLDAMVAHFNGDRAYDCWLTEGNAFRAMILAQRGRFDDATAALRDAERTSYGALDKPVLLQAEGEIAANRGDIESARALFWQAYKAANALTPRFIRIIELALMRYAEVTQSVDEQSCELACALLHEITGNNGMPHVRDARQTLTARIPNR